MWRSNNHELHSIIFYAYAFSSVMIVALTTIVVMLLISIKRNHNLIATASVVGLNLAALYILFAVFGGKFVPQM